MPGLPDDKQLSELHKIAEWSCVTWGATAVGIVIVGIILGSFTLAILFYWSKAKQSKNLVSLLGQRITKLEKEVENYQILELAKSRNMEPEEMRRFWHNEKPVTDTKSGEKLPDSSKKKKKK